VVFVFSAIGMGGGTFLAQNIYFLIIAGLKPVDCFDVGVGGFMLAVIFIATSWFVLDKIGRRTVFIGGSIVNALGMLIIGCLAYAPGTGALWAIAVIM
jgi:SP family general alpha glucoside:H+ symporter-like MFS transporter